MTPVRPLVVAAAVLVLPASAGLFGTPVAAGGGVQKDGHCSRYSDWELRAQPDDGRIRVRGEVDSNRTGQRWRWRILHDGAVTARGRATTRGRGSFEVERLILNAPGEDHIGWRAINRASGETCRGRLTY